MIHSSRSRTTAAALTAALCVGALSAQFAVAQTAPGPAAAHAEAKAVPTRAPDDLPGGMVLHSSDPNVASRAISAMKGQDPATYRIELTDPKTGRRTILGSLSPDVLEKGDPNASLARRWRPGRGMIIIFIYVRSATNRAAYARLNAALSSADKAAYTLTEVR